MLTRAMLFEMLQGSDSPRDIDTACFYKVNPQPIDYQHAYDTNGVAARVVEIMPDECWSLDFSLVERGSDTSETAWEGAVKSLITSLNIDHMLHRVDTLSRIGNFGVMLLGFDDGRPLDKPVGNAKGRKLSYVRTFAEVNVTVSTYEEDTQSPRYGQPTSYHIIMATPGVIGVVGSNEGVGVSKSVHWTRVLHIADFRQSSEVFGSSALRRVYNWVHTDLRKLAGGSVEMFWQGAFPGLFLSLDPKAELTAEVRAAIKEQLVQYSNTLQRYLTIAGAEIQELRPQVSDPNPQFTLLMQLCAISIGCPLRVFMGTEEGKLASGQDAIAWLGRVHRRREKYCGPLIIRPFVERLMEIGVLERVEFDVHWPDPHNVSDKEHATTAALVIKAMSEYLTKQCDALLPHESFFEELLGWDHDKATRVLEKARARAVEIEAERKQLADAAIAAAQQGAAAVPVVTSIAAPAKSGRRRKATATPDPNAKTTGVPPKAV